MLTLEQQVAEVFLPSTAARDAAGMTPIRLAVASEDALYRALRTAWKLQMEKNAKSGKKNLSGNKCNRNKKAGEMDVEKMKPVKKTGLAELLTGLRKIPEARGPRIPSLQAAADHLRQIGPYRWVGLYDVDPANGMVRNVVWSGPGAPEYPTFPVTKGLTSAAIASRKTINVGKVAADPRYLTAFSSTRSEIIIPVLDASGELVIGTIDIESESLNAFDADTQSMLEAAAEILRPLWHSVDRAN